MESTFPIPDSVQTEETKKSDNKAAPDGPARENGDPARQSGQILYVGNQLGIVMGATDHVTDPAKFDIITPTQAEDNERRRVQVSRSFISEFADVCELQHAHART